MKIVAYIPIKHNSQRVPGKNFRLLGNKPLYQYILDTLQEIPAISTIYIDTDSPELQSATFPPQIQVINRPDHLKGDTTSVNQLIYHFVRKEELDDDTIIIQTHVTNPFLTKRTIQIAIDLLRSSSPETFLPLFTSNQIQKRFWTEDLKPINHNPDRLLQTQDLNPIYLENSSLYIFTASTVLKYQNRLGPKNIMYPMSSHIESMDIDTEEDFRMAEHLLPLITNQIQSTIPTQYTTEEINETLYQKLIEETSSLRPVLNPQNQTVMISAPYMMKDIMTFKTFFETVVGVSTIIPTVEERLEESALLDIAGTYQVALVGDDRYSKEVIDQSTHPEKPKLLKALCKWGTGIDSLNPDYCQTKNVKVYNTPNAFTIPVVQSIISSILNHLRNTQISHQKMHKTNVWAKIPSLTIEEVTIGIIGLGAIGSHLATVLKQSFNANLVGYDIVDKSVLKTNHIIDHLSKTSEDLISRSDIICLCSTLSSSSRYIINKKSLQNAKPHTYIINMSRGDLIDESALISALTSTPPRLSGASLDVFEQEPLPETSPLRHLPNVIINAHNANSSPKAWDNVHLNTVKNALKALSLPQTQQSCKN